MKWKLTIRANKKAPTGYIYQSKEDWIKASAKTPRQKNDYFDPRRYVESDFDYRCRAWSVYTGCKVVDWEWKD